MASWQRRGVITALAVLAGSFSIVVPARAQEESEPIVAELRIEGNEAFPDRELRRAIFTEPSECKSFFLKPFCAVGAFRDRRALDRREFQLDLARLKLFYWRRGYREVQVDTTVRALDGEVAVTFRVDEGRPVRVRTLQLAGLSGIVSDTAGLRRRLALNVGEPFSVLQVETARGQIEQLLHNRGFAHAQVLLDAFLPSDEPYTAEVTFQVEPGPLSRFGQIHVLGSERVEPQVVRRLLTFRQGDLYRENEIVRSRRNLYSVALFQYADVTPQLEERDSVVDVWVRVNEANVHAVREGIGVSTAECFEVEASWTHRNFLGSARRLELGGALSNLFTRELAGGFPCSDAGDTVDVESPFNKLNWLARAEFRQPWFISSRNVLRAGLFAERQSLPVIFVRVSYGGDVTLERDLGSRSTLNLTYRTERDSLDAGSASLFFCGTFGFCLPRDIRELSKPRWLSWVALGWVGDRTDAVFHPTRGYVARIEVEHASRFTHSEYAYYRVWADLSVYRPLGDGVLALRLRPGWVRPLGRGIELEAAEARPTGPDVVHPFKRFYAGGANTIRGFGQNLAGPTLLFLPQADTLLGLGCDTANIDSTTNIWNGCSASGLPAGSFQPRPLGGTISLVGNVELRFPLFGERWFGAVFVDWGQVWQDQAAFEEAIRRGFLSELEWTPGIGLRYLSPVGPLRVDVGYNTIGPRLLPVVTRAPETNQVVQLEEPFRYDPFSHPRGFQEFLNRLQVHFSLGQAF